MTHKGRLFHSNISWEEDDDIDDEPELDEIESYTIRSRTLLPTYEMPSQEELLDLMMASYTIMGLRLLGELPGHHPLAASWRQEEEEDDGKSWRLTVLEEQSRNTVVNSARIQLIRQTLSP